MHHLQGTGLAANFMATHMDPQIWENPEQFSPHRFLRIFLDALASLEFKLSVSQ